MSEAGESLVPARLAQTFPKLRIIAGLSREKSFHQLGNFSSLDFHPASELKKDLGIKLNKSNFPHSSNKQITPIEGKETLQEKEKT